MTLSNEYKAQYQWRSWARVYEAIGDLKGKHMLDLGCAVGDQSADLAHKGAIVTGIDGNADLLEQAKAKNLPNARFICADLSALEALGETFDLIWCSFVIAYFPQNMANVLKNWKKRLKPNGKLVSTEMSGLLNHYPMSEDDQKTLAAFYEDAFTNNRYDFFAGQSMVNTAKQAGFTIRHNFTLDDAELCFTGPAQPDIFAAWQKRIDRMGGLKNFVGPDFCARFLQTLQHKNHSTGCKVTSLVCSD